MLDQASSISLDVSTHRVSWDCCLQ